ncbi:MAG: flagellar hook-associated protein FlgL [Nitrospinae bacterium]|nr:flagellar hook-associated protein FlgL [Nitrospinota bacterium]
MFRITNRMMYNSTLFNAFRNNAGMMAAQEQLSSGKRINRPSDDPIGMMEVLQFRTNIGKTDQYLRVMDNADSYLNTADSITGSAHDQLKSAKELALQQSGGVANAQTRINAATTIDAMIQQMIQYGNTRVGDRYIFSGQRSDQQAIDANGNYVGSQKDLRAEINVGTTIPISVKASEFLTADMSPAMSNVAGATTLASLNGGTGVPGGTFTITNRLGASAVVDTTAGPITDVNGLLAAINATGLNVTASLSADGSALVLTDNNANPIQALSITDGGAGTARALGIEGSRNTSVFTGTDLNPNVTGTTLLSSLYGGTGLPLDDIKLFNGGASATMSFAGATTVQDVLNAINAAGAGINLTASISASGNRLSITSTNPLTVAYATDTGSGKTADMLGVGGGRNIIPVLQMFSAALKANDTSAILGAVGLLDSTMENTNSVRGTVGARANQVVSTREAVDQSKYDNTKLKSQVEDADFLQAASELAMLQTAYQATLKSSSSIVQPSLLDFLR